MINLSLAFLTQVIMVLIAVAYLTLLERKIMASIQRRRGPNVVGIFGLLQPFADGLKLFTKELFIPVKANRLLFVLAPTIFLAFSFISWGLIPLTEGKSIADLNLGLLFVLTISSFSVYGLIFGGWASNSQYAFLGGLRSAAQMISYEISLSLLVFTVILLTQSLNLTAIITIQENLWLILPLFAVAVIFFISALAETSRPPFDLPEAEAELVAGYNVEYSAMGFAFFFIAEYMNIIFMCFLTVILFFGGWLRPFALTLLDFLPSSVWLFVKAIVLITLFIWIRASFPRFRYDQLINLCWRIFLPLSFSCFIFTFNMVSTVPGIDDVTLDTGEIIVVLIKLGSGLLVAGGAWMIYRAGLHDFTHTSVQLVTQVQKDIQLSSLDAVAKAVGARVNHDPEIQRGLNALQEHYTGYPPGAAQAYVGWLIRASEAAVYGLPMLILGVVGLVGVVIYKYNEPKPEVIKTNFEIIPGTGRIRVYDSPVVTFDPQATSKLIPQLIPPPRPVASETLMGFNLNFILSVAAILFILGVSYVLITYFLGASKFLNHYSFRPSEFVSRAKPIFFRYKASFKAKFHSIFYGLTFFLSQVLFVIVVFLIFALYLVLVYFVWRWLYRS